MTLPIISGEIAIQKLLNRKSVLDSSIESRTKDILDAVIQSGDGALRELTQKFDGPLLPNFEVSLEEVGQAFENVGPKLVEALTQAKENIETYHKKQLDDGYEIKDHKQVLRQIITPIENVGIYVPGGKAAYPSTVLMNAVPAKLAGVGQIIMVTPPAKDGTIKDSLLVAAKLAGVDRIFKVGGAQSVAALAYGTNSIPKVDKIVGPGNAYVAMAKKLVAGEVGIDMIAGPSEVVILADETANPAWVVADLMAQAEHDEMASSIVITTSKELADEVLKSVAKLLPKQPRKEIIEASFKDYGAIIIVDSMDEAVDISNALAPEHLEIQVADPFALLPKVKHAGAIFMGYYTPESVGDYYAGTNHTLPTSGTARFSNPLNVADFQKKTSLVYYTKEALQEAQEHIGLIADEEGLYAHKLAVDIRLGE